MTNEKAITIIRNEYKCVDRDCDIEKSCGKCDLMMPSKEPILEAYKMAIKALDQQPITTTNNDEPITVIYPTIVCDDAISDIMGISKSRTHDIMENELRCVQRASCGGCDRECGECSLLMDDKEIIKAYGYVIRMLELPSVTQKSGTGHWILQPSNKEQDERDFIWWKCSECGQVIFSETEKDRREYHAFCSRCGAKMV